jgi:hypothetical protein
MDAIKLQRRQNPSHSSKERDRRHRVPVHAHYSKRTDCFNPSGAMLICMLSDVRVLNNSDFERGRLPARELQSLENQVLIRRESSIFSFRLLRRSTRYMVAPFPTPNLSFANNYIGMATCT